MATVASETIDSKQGNNRAEVSAIIVEAVKPAATAGLTLAISGDINPATVSPVPADWSFEAASPT